MITVNLENNKFVSYKYTVSVMFWAPSNIYLLYSYLQYRQIYHFIFSGETPPYHYGTHYSSAMIVASYLLRMEPFTQHFLKLQGGHFDLADRMFHSVKENWLSASKNNMADVKELIPEFFYLPEFLLNSNKFDLGEFLNIQIIKKLCPDYCCYDHIFEHLSRMQKFGSSLSSHTILKWY